MNSGSYCVYDKNSPCEECGDCDKRSTVRQAVYDERRNETYNYVSYDSGETWRNDNEL